MIKQLSMTLLLVVFFWGCGRTPTPEAKVEEKTFTFDSVKYTTGGLPKTSKFEKGIAMIRADAVKSEITLQGSYGPGDPAVTAIEVNTDPVVSVTPKFNEGKWSATIEANKLQTNMQYAVQPVVKKGDNKPEFAKLAISIN